MQLEEPTIRAGVAHQQHHAAQSGITELEAASTVERLSVTQARFRLHRDIVRLETQHDVPRPSISDDGEWHLRTNRNTGRQSGSQPTDQRKLRSIERDAAARQGPDLQLQANCCATSAQLFDVSRSISPSSSLLRWVCDYPTRAAAARRLVPPEIRESRISRPISYRMRGVSAALS